MNQKVRNALIGLIPLILAVVAVVYAPGTTAKVLTGWGFILGAFAGAFGATLLVARKADR